VVNINVKVFNSIKVKDCPVYVLRGVNEQVITTPKKFREEIQKQFRSQLVSKSKEFPFGYMKDSTKVHIRTAADVLDVWNFIKKGEQILSWCQGNLHEVSDSDSDEEMLKRP